MSLCCVVGGVVVFEFDFPSFVVGAVVVRLDARLCLVLLLVWTDGCDVAVHSSVHSCE